jgi:Ca2+-binding EF-hand superfamily protein
MPINENEFGKSSRDPSIVLLEFLDVNARTAYSLEELVEVVNAEGRDLAPKDVESLLSALEYGGKVKSRTIDGKTYYKHSVVRGLKVI